ncbi:hypothetical protein C8R47DRAFT_1103830 [Mycena vitilis]|nr:hypothetical protein C8R47DRAFT_1103830 [Mycena vitilis]
MPITPAKSTGVKRRITAGRSSVRPKASAIHTHASSDINVPDTPARSTGVKRRVPAHRRNSLRPKASSASADRPGVVYRGILWADSPRTRDPTSQLECGGPQEEAVGSTGSANFGRQIFAGVGSVLRSVLSLGAILVWVLLLCLRFICVFGRHLVYASELESIRTQALDCGDETRHFLCAKRPNVPLPAALVSFQRSWEVYIERKISEWSLCSYLAGFFAAFILGALQIAEKNDPLTRVLAFIAFFALAASVMVNQLLPHHLNNTCTREVHYAFHFLECAHDDPPSFKVPALLSISSITTWWGIILSVFTFASVFYHDTQSTGSTSDSLVPLDFWQMIVSRVVMVAICLMSTVSLFWMHMTLKSYANAVEHPPVPQESR